MNYPKIVWTKPSLIILDTNSTEDGSKLVNTDGVGLGT